MFRGLSSALCQMGPPPGCEGYSPVETRWLAEIAVYHDHLTSIRSRWVGDWVGGVISPADGIEDDFMKWASYLFSRAWSLRGSCAWGARMRRKRTKAHDLDVDLDWRLLRRTLEDISTACSVKA